MLSEMGVNVIEAEEAEDDGEEGSALRKPKARKRSPRPPPRQTQPLDRTDDPVRMYLREMGTVELLCPERARSRSPSASRRAGPR